MQFRGLPKELREFLIIWAIGSILGVPRAVDTKFTKKYGRARLKVVVLDPDLIPDLVDVVIGDFVYELQFRVEKILSDGEAQVVDMDATTDDDKPPEKKEAENMDEDANKLADDPADIAPGMQPNVSVAPSGQHNNSAIGTHTEQMDIDLAPQLSGNTGVQPDSVLDIISLDQQVNLARTGSDPVQKKNVSKPVVLLTQTGMTQDGSALWKASSMQPKSDSGLLNKSLKQSGGAVSLVRASKRNAFTSEQDSLEKATKLKARKNLDDASLKGKETLPRSFDSLDDSTLLATTSLLGVSFGNCDQEITFSLKSLKDLEANRLVESSSLKVNNKFEVDDFSSICSLDENLDLENLNHLCGDISEELGDGGCDPLGIQTPLSHVKKTNIVS